MTPIKLRRLQDVAVKGNFTINCEDNLQFIMLQQFFCISSDNIRFKNVHKIPTYICSLIPSHFPFVPVMISGDTRTKFIIRYETLAELLKLRELFRVRSSKFDMYLIKKRGYNMLTTDFYKLCENTDIQRVRK